VALILALNPANSHSPTLSRLARELKGCELIGADSCPTAIKAIKERVPDVVLLPAKQARGQADLLAHLQKIPGGVLTLQLPPVESADPIALAKQIREMLTGTSESPSASATAADPPGASPYLIAAANAAIDWIRTRRANWAKPQDLTTPAAAYAMAPPVPIEEPYEPPEPQYYEPIPLSDEPIDTVEHPEPEEPSVLSRAAAGVGGTVKSWLPRIAALAIFIGVGAAVVSYWPRTRGRGAPTVDQSNRPAEPAASPSAPDAAPQPSSSPPTAVTPAAEPDPLGNVSGWVAVFAPFDITISEGGTGIPVDERGRAMLTPGRHRLRFQNLDLGYDETRTVNVKPTDTTTVNLNPQATIAVTSNEPAEVLIDGTRVGETPYNGKVSLGTHAVTVRTAGAERQLTIQASSKPLQLEVDFSKP
jgi:hypothetical protein